MQTADFMSKLRTLWADGGFYDFMGKASSHDLVTRYKNGRVVLSTLKGWWYLSERCPELMRRGLAGRIHIE